MTTTTLYPASRRVTSSALCSEERCSCRQEIAGVAGAATQAELAAWQPMFDNAKKLRALPAELQELTLTIIDADPDSEP